MECRYILLLSVFICSRIRCSNPKCRMLPSMFTRVPWTGKIKIPQSSESMSYTVRACVARVSAPIWKVAVNDHLVRLHASWYAVSYYLLYVCYSADIIVLYCRKSSIALLMSTLGILRTPMLRLCSGSLCPTRIPNLCLT